MTEQIIGITAGVFTALSLVPQLRKMLKERRAGDVSLGMFLTLLVGLGLWVSYGIIKTDWPIIITNSFSFLTNCVILFLHLKYKHIDKRG